MNQELNSSLTVCEFEVGVKVASQNIAEQYIRPI